MAKQSQTLLRPWKARNRIVRRSFLLFLIYGNILLVGIFIRRFLSAFSFQFMQINSKRQRGGGCCWGSETNWVESEINLWIYRFVFHFFLKPIAGLMWLEAIYTRKLIFPSSKHFSRRLLLSSINRSLAHPIVLAWQLLDSIPGLVSALEKGLKRDFLPAQARSRVHYFRDACRLVRWRLGKIIELESCARIQKVSLRLCLMVLRSRVKSLDAWERRKACQTMALEDLWGFFLSSILCQHSKSLKDSMVLLCNPTKGFKVDDDGNWNSIRVHLSRWRLRVETQQRVEVKSMLLPLGRTKSLLNEKPRPRNPSQPRLPFSDVPANVFTFSFRFSKTITPARIDTKTKRPPTPVSRFSH